LLALLYYFWTPIFLYKFKSFMYYLTHSRTVYNSHWVRVLSKGKTTVYGRRLSTIFKSVKIRFRSKKRYL
jgi:hypothetical protein